MFDKIFCCKDKIISIKCVSLAQISPILVNFSQKTSMKKRLNFLVSLLVLSLFACQVGVKFDATSAAQIHTGLTQEIPNSLLCGDNRLTTTVIDDTTIQYQIEIFKGLQNKYKIKKGNTTKFYPKVTDPQNRGFEWVSYRSIEKKDTIVAVFAYDSAGIFVTGKFSIKSKIEPFECNEFRKNNT